MTSLLAQTSIPSAVSTDWEIDWPYSPGEWGLALGCLAVIVYSLLLYRRDARGLPPGWAMLLAALRVGALGGLLVVLLNPHMRTQSTGYRPSRVILLVDTSSSMRQPERTPGPQDSAPGASIRSRAEAVQSLLAESPLLDTLRRKHVVDVYPFDVDLRPQVARLDVAPEGGEPAPAPPMDWAAALAPAGVLTRLGDSLDKLLVEARSRTLAGVVVFTDGANNVGRDVRAPQERARAQGARLFAVGVGGTEPPVNLAVARVVAPTDVQKGDAFSLTAFVQSQNAGSQTAVVELLEQGPDDAAPAVVETREIRLLEGAPVEAPFERRPTAGGAYAYTLRVAAPGLVETRGDDNQLQRTVNVFDRPLKLLVIAGAPMREYVFARNLLFRHKSIDIDVWLQTGEPGISQEADQLLFKFPETREELFAYDALLAFDVDWTLLSLDQQKMLAEWTSNEGAGVLFVAGDVHTPMLAAAGDANEPIRTLLPVELDETALRIVSRDRADTPWAPSFTVEGQAAEFLQLADTRDASTEAWKSAPGLYRCYPTRRRKAGAAVYLEFSDPAARGPDGQHVLLAGQRYGQGAALYLGSPELWRLRAVDEALYERLWVKLVRKAAEGRAKRGVQRALILLEGREFELGQTAPVRLRAVTADFQPLAADAVRLDVFDPQGRPMIPAPMLERDRNRASEYTGSFRLSLPGKHRLEFTVPGTNEKAQAEIDVLLPQKEFAVLQQDAAALRTLVEGTGGQYLTLDEAAAKLPDLLPNAGEQFLIDQRVKELWDRGWMLGLLVGLLGVEWLWRKLLKLA